MEDNNKMEPFKPSKWIKRMILITALVIIIIGAIVYRSLAVFPFALGVLATSGLNILLYGMIERTVHKVLYMEDQVHGKNIVTLHSMLRILITGAVLAVIGITHNFTSPPPVYNPNRLYIGVWASIFPGAPESLLTAPFISLWGALFGIFTLKLSLKLIGFLKLEKDGEHFVKYADDDDDENDNKNGEDVENFKENAISDNDSTPSVIKEDDSE